MQILSYGKPELIAKIKGFFNGIDIKIVIKNENSFSYEKFLEDFNKVKPDAIFIDNFLIQNNNSLICLLNLLNVKLNNNIFVVNNNACDNNKLTLLKDVIFNKEQQFVENFNKQNLSISQIHNIIEEKLDYFGFNRCHIGYHYLATAIEICYEHNCFIKNLTTEIYQELAKIYNSTIYKIERNIRTAINYVTHQRTYRKGNPMNIQKTTNRNVIFYFANILKRENLNNSQQFNNAI